MKTHIYLFPYLLAVTILSSLCSVSFAASDDYADQLTHARLFPQSLVWVGATAPSQDETMALWRAAGLDATSNPGDPVGSMDAFVKAHTDSAWTPSVEANLARYYYSEGRYSVALDYWQKAWAATKNAADPHSRMVADYTLAYWSQLLSSLGRVDELNQLITAVNGRQLSNQDYQRQFNLACRSAAMMKHEPGASYRCGTFALFHVAQALNLKTDFSPLLNMDSPDTGFSLARLMDFSTQYQLGLVAVKRPAGNQLVVPSLVHWNENHYAAIVEKRDGAYKVIDPTFGSSRWLTAEVINENASGYFMVPTNAIPLQWKQVSPDEAKTVFGKGVYNGGQPPPSRPTCDANGNPCATCSYPCPPGGGGGSGPGGNGPGGNGPGGNGPGGGGGCGGGHGCMSSGMPYWEVQEPFISLWLHDRPMVYNMSFGRQFVLQMDYHQAETRPTQAEGNAYNGIYLSNFGPKWNCNLLTYIQVDGDVKHGWEDDSQEVGTNWDIDVEPTISGQIQGTEFSPDGGVQTFTWGGTNFDNTMDQYSHIQINHNGYNLPGDLELLEGTWYTNTYDHFSSNTLVYPNGSVATFGLVVTVQSFPDQKLALLTSATDPQGHVMNYFYSTNSGLYLLTQVVDFDGKTNNFVYGNASYPSEITQITNTAYGLAVNFRYDSNGNLTNIIDVMGISSSFKYTTTNDAIFYSYDTFGAPQDPVDSYVTLLTTLHTPYGNTDFEYFHPTWPYSTLETNTPFMGSFGYINRAITVTQPDSGKHLFVYKDRVENNDAYPEYTISLPTGFNADADTNYGIFMSQIGQPSSPGDGGAEIYNNDSYYWGPRQYAALSTTDLTNIQSDNDFLLARQRNWLHSSPDDYSTWTLSQSLNAEQDVSRDPYHAGKSVWYGYEGKPFVDMGVKYIESTNDALSCSIGFSTSDDNVANHFENIFRNELGYPTMRVEFGTDINSVIFIRTNTYVYAANQIDLLRHIGPDGVVQEAYSYDGNHQVLSMTNALGEVTSYTYNGNGQITTMTSPTGLLTTYTYGSNGFLAQQIVTGFSTNSYTYTNGLVYTHTDERGLTTTNTWDALQRLTKVSYPDGTSVSYVYINLSLAKVVDRMGFANGYTYDSMQRRTAVTNALVNVTHYNYCNCGLLDSIVDAAGNTTTFSYDIIGHLTNTAYADGFNIGRTYNRYGSIINTTDSSGNSVNNYYDGEVRLIAVTNTAGRLATYTYDENDLVKTNVNANGVSVCSTYDDLHRLTTRAYPDMGVEKFGYTLNLSGPTSYTNQIGNIVLYNYDLLNRKTTEVYVGVTTNGFVYSGAGDLLTLTDGKSQNTTWKYDEFGRVTNKLDNLSASLFVYKYDPDNRLTNRWSAAKANTFYKYDAVGNLTNVVYPVSTQIKLRYDVVNRLTSMVDAVGTTVYAYDAVGQLLNEGGLWADDTVSYSYTNRLRVGMSISAPNAAPWAQTYAYDDMRRLTNVTSSAGVFGYDYTLGFDPYFGTLYSANSLIHALSLPNGAFITNTFDGNARLLSTTLANSGGTDLDSYDYSYNQANQRTSVTRAAGDYVNYTYDNMGELKTAVGKEIGGVTNRWQEQFGYAYDAAGNLNYRTNNALVQTFNVNSLNELTTSTNAGRLTVAGSTTSPATNVTVNTSNAVLYADVTFASTNQPWVNGNNTFTAIAKDAYGRRDTNAITILQATNNYTYDSNGNLLYDGRRAFAYDDENQLISVTATNNWKSEFTYDGKMRRRIVKESTWNGSSWTQTNEVHYIYDGNLVVQERDTNNLPQVTYTRGTDLSGSMQGAGGIGGLLARTDNSKLLISDPFATAFYHADGNGNVTCLIYPSQTIAAKYLYDPYGNMLSQYGSLSDANNYRFSSKEWNQNSGLYYYLYRLYDASSQRWVNRDPFSESGHRNIRGACVSCYVPFMNDDNLFLFCDNIPTRKYDSFGLVTKADCDAEYDDAMKKANKAGTDCLTSAIEWGVVGEVILGGGGVIVGTIIGAPEGGVGALPGAGIGLVGGTGLNMLIDFCHIHHCEAKVNKMKKDAEDVRNECYKEAGVKSGE